MRRPAHWTTLPLACILALAPSCSVLGADDEALVNVEADPIALETESTVDMFAADRLAGITEQDVLDAIVRLEGDRPFTATYTSSGMFGIASDAQGNPAVAIETVVYHPDAEARFVSTDHGAVFDALMAVVSETAQEPEDATDEEYGETAETMLPAVLAIAAGMSVPVDYYLADDTMWVPYEAWIASSRASIEVSLAAYPTMFDEYEAEYEEATGDTLTEEELLQQFGVPTPDPALAGMWIKSSLPSDDGLFPAGEGEWVGPAMALSMLDLIDFDGSTPPSGLLIEQVAVGVDTATFALSVDDDYSVEIELDASLDVASVSFGGSGDIRRVEFVWSADQTLLQLPSADQIYDPLSELPNTYSDPAFEIYDNLSPVEKFDTVAGVMTRCCGSRI